jgi:hypothetical protein
MVKEKVKELLDVLRRDEVSLRNTIINATGQLNYNLKVQRELEKILTMESKNKKK